LNRKELLEHQSEGESLVSFRSKEECVWTYTTSVITFTKFETDFSTV